MSSQRNNTNPYPPRIHFFRTAIPHPDLGIIPPPLQYIPIVSQKASLSVDRLVFGRVPQRTELTKICIIKNLSKLPLKFNLDRHEWQQQDLDEDDESCLSIYPSDGVIEPGKQQLLKITFSGNGFPRIIDETLAVELMEEPEEPGRVAAKDVRSKQSERVQQMKQKVGETPHVPIVTIETLSRIGNKLDRFLLEAGKCGRYEGEKRQELLKKAYLMLTGVANRNQAAENFIETVIRKLVKVGMKEDIDELALEGNLEPRSLDDIMDELEETYKRKRKEPEIKLAFMLYGIDNEDLPPGSAPEKGGTSNVGSMEGKVSWSESFDGSGAGSAAMLPSTGMRGTMLVPRNLNKKKAADIVAARPDKTFLFLHVTGEIVEEEVYFTLFGGDLNSDGIRIPTTREFICNPKEVVPAGLIVAKDEFLTEGSIGECGGAKESAAVKGLVTTMFTELVTSNDVNMQMDELPPAPRNPYLGEVQKRPPLMTSLQAAFDLFDVDASGTLTNAEVTNALKHLGLSTANAEVKRFLKELDKNGDDEVDMREFLAGLNKEMAHKIADALETNEEMIVALRSERQKQLEQMKLSPRDQTKEVDRKASQDAVTLGLIPAAQLEQEVVVEEVSQEENSAALKIQQRARSRKAKQLVEKKRFMATAEGAEMNSAAMLIQGKARQRKARADLRKQAEVKMRHKLAVANQDEDLRQYVPKILNETLFNLLREAMETPLNDSKIEDLERKLKEQDEINGGGLDEVMAVLSADTRIDTAKSSRRGTASSTLHPKVLDEDELAEIEDELDALRAMPKFDLNLKPKTFVKSLEEE